MRKSLGMLLAAFLILSLSLGSALAEDAQDESDFNIDAEGTLIGYTGTQAEVVIPDGVNVIGAEVFIGNTSIMSVTIPEGVTRIEDGAFQECTALKAVSLPSTLEAIGSQAFYQCLDLSEIELPKGLETIGRSAFRSCTSLSDIVVPASVTTIGNHAFDEAGNSNPSFAVSFEDRGSGIPLAIGTYAFANCSRLTELDFPEGLETLPTGVCSYSSISSVSIPSSVTDINMAFYMATNLQTIYTSAISPALSSPFASCPIKKIYYAGTQSQWQQSTWVSVIEKLQNPPTITSLNFVQEHFTYQMLPDEDGNYEKVDKVKIISSETEEGATSLTIPVSVAQDGETYVVTGCEPDVFTDTAITLIKYDGTKKQWQDFDGAPVIAEKGILVQCSDGTYPVLSVSLSLSELELEPGDTEEITAKVTGEDTEVEYAAAEVTWNSSDPAKVSISPSDDDSHAATITAIADGTVTVTGCCGETDDECIVTVKTSTSSSQPSTSPTRSPDASAGQSTSTPSKSPSIEPTSPPSSSPSKEPTGAPSESQTVEPTSSPTGSPSILPTPTPTKSPIVRPSSVPSHTGPELPTARPTSFHTTRPTYLPTYVPSPSASSSATASPSLSPFPSGSPSPSESTSPNPSVSAGPTDSIADGKISIANPSGSMRFEVTQNFTGVEGPTAGRELDDCTTISQILSQITAPENAIIVCRDVEGKTIAQSTAARTGQTITYIDGRTGREIASVIVIVKGDVTGDGIVNIADVVVAARVVRGDGVLEGPYYFAADMTDDGKIDMADVVRIARLISGAEQARGSDVDRVGAIRTTRRKK